MKRDNHFEGGAAPEEPKKEEPKKEEPKADEDKGTKSDYRTAWWLVLSGLTLILILVLIVVMTLNHE